jgi:hypothetical protein
LDYLFTVTGGNAVNRNDRNIGLSNFMTDRLHQQEENPYSEIRHSQLQQTCAATNIPSGSGDDRCSNAPSLHTKKENVYGKCASESYDHIEFKKRFSQHATEYSTQKIVHHVEQCNRTDEGKRLSILSFKEYKHCSFTSLPGGFYGTALNDTEMTSFSLFRTLSEPNLHQIKSNAIKTAVKDPMHGDSCKDKRLKPVIDVDVRPYSLVMSFSSNH